MASISARLFRPVVRRMGAELQAADTPEKARAVSERYSRLLFRPLGVRIEHVTLGTVPALKVAARGAPTRGAVLLLHGGGYVFGSAHGYRAFAARLAKGARLEVFALDYRLAPEHPYPAAVDDAVCGYRALLDAHAAERVAFVGDSAGGGLALATMHQAAAEALPRPACGVLLSPWLDLTGAAASMTSNAATELLIPPPTPARMAAWYAGERDLTEPGVSPLFAEPAGLPPLLVFADKGEVLLDDATRFADGARAAGVDVTLRLERDLWHNWPLLAPFVREARHSLAEILEFLEARIS
jgi:epsilon-lactone hydrolase